MKSAGLGGCIASKNLLTKKGNIRWCIKEKATNELDNGWRFLSDTDTDEFLQDAGNLVICDWNTIVEIEPAILPIFNLPVGTELTLIEENRQKYFLDNETGEKLILE